MKLKLTKIKIENLKKEYDLKKDKIKVRLNQFQQFFNKPYSWQYQDGDLHLIETNKTDDERIFEELCFCILTANTSAQMGLKAIDSLRDFLLTASEEEMKKTLNGIYRFSNIRPEYIVHTRNYLIQELNFKLKEKIQALQNDKDKLRDFFAVNKGIKGLGYKEASHFLRNIGFQGYAIIDKHILSSLFEFNIITEIKRPSTKIKYHELEQKIMQFAEQINIPFDDLDLLLWSRKNGQILK